MPICTSKRCPYEGEWQPESEFNGNNWCRTCRERSGKKNPFGRHNSNAVNKDKPLEPGDPPAFRNMSDKKRWETWLKELAQEVIRSDT